MSQVNPKRRGNASIVALSLVPVMGFGALSVDIGMQRTTSLQIQSAAEAGSLAGSARLNGSVDGIVAAEAYAFAIANLNDVYGTTTFDVTDVEAGVYDPGNNTFTPYTNQDPATVNAVRVSDSRTIDSILARAAFGLATLGVEGSAIAIQPRGGVPMYVDCFLPISIPACVYETADAQDGSIDNEINVNPGPVEINLNAGSDNGGWGIPTPLGPTNNSNAAGLLADGCSAGTASTAMDVDANGGAWGGTLNATVGVINDAGGWATYDADGPPPTIPPIFWPPLRGVGIVQSLADSPIEDPVPANGIATDAEPWGGAIAGVMPIARVPGTSAGNCVGIPWNADYQIVGWTYGYIFDVELGGDKAFFVQADFLNDYDIGYGQCVEDPNTPELECMGNVTGTFPSSLVL